jgi:alpha-beta hydrolase superfamily lysophospholipase
MVQRELDAGVVSSVSGERACVLTRRTPPTRGLSAIICCHGRGQNHLAYGPGLATSDPIMRLVEAGYVAISLDNGGTTSWGNDNAIQTITDAVAYSAAQFGTSTTRVLLFGMSMGSQLALNWAARNPSKVAAIALSFPVTDLAAISADANGSHSTLTIDPATGNVNASAGGSTTKQSLDGIHFYAEG